MSWLKKFLPIGEEQSQGPRFGFQVLKNTGDLTLEPWFDFICGINGRLIEDGNSYLFSQELQNCAGRNVTLTIWSAKGQRMRDASIRVPVDTGLGLTLQWCPLSVTDEIWHILDVAANSPADLAGLLPYSDYIIGTPEGTVRGESGLGELVEDHVDRPLRIYVYNHEYDVTREITITPTRSWGGEGMLGCVLGFGALHRLPAPLHEPVQAPGETLFDSVPDEMFPPTEPGSLTTPAATFTPLTPPMQHGFRTLSPTEHLLGAQQPTSTTRAKPRRAHHSALDMDGYLKEGEQKSKELDSGGTATGAKGLPPPPKGGPPPPRKTPTTSPPPVNEPQKEGEEDEID